jgi:hypothetical protein
LLPYALHLALLDVFMASIPVSIFIPTTQLRVLRVLTSVVRVMVYISLIVRTAVRYYARVHSLTYH